MNRREALVGLCLSPVIGTLKELPENELEVKKRKIFELIQELYSFPVDVKLEGNIRLWKVGIYDPEFPQNAILPTKQAIDKIKNILMEAKKQNPELNNCFDMIWGPELDCKTV